MSKFAHERPQMISRVKSFGGWTEFYTHRSAACDLAMRFSVYLPPQAASGPVPVLYWLSGLTCTEENFMVKAGAQQFASRHGVMLVAPDTSPRGAGIAGEDASWDFGLGAGFYVDATRAPWSAHYRMYEYVSEELAALIQAFFPAEPGRESIFGHSMGGHGAMVLALRQPGRYASVSAFAPICSPTRCPWGEKALGGYLGDDRTQWAGYDTCLLIERAEHRQEILVDQGSADKFLQEQLKPSLLRETCAAKGFPLQLRFQEGYDHSYYFISSFIEEHIAYHAGFLKGQRSADYLPPRSF